jgi:hypothetical protein
MGFLVVTILTFGTVFPYCRRNNLRDYDKATAGRPRCKQEARGIQRESDRRINRLRQRYQTGGINATDFITGVAHSLASFYVDCYYLPTATDLLLFNLLSACSDSVFVVVVALLDSIT